MQIIAPEIDDDVEIQVAYQSCKVSVDKCFGPLVFCGIRVHADAETCEWVIEKERIKKMPNGDFVSSWEEIKRFDAQESIDFE